MCMLERKPTREQERVAHEWERGGPALVQPEQRSRGSDEVQGQITDAEEADETRDHVSRILHVSFDEDVR
jgi:hypothetical protein